MEAQQFIGMKAGHVLRHYFENVLSRGLEAQAVAVSRRAAARYRDALNTSLGELVHRPEHLPAHPLDLSPEVFRGSLQLTMPVLCRHANTQTLSE